MGEFGLIFSRIQSLLVHAPLRIHYDQICKKNCGGLWLHLCFGLGRKGRILLGSVGEISKVRASAIVEFGCFLQILVKGLNTLQSAIASKICEYPWNWVNVVLG